MIPRLWGLFAPLRPVAVGHNARARSGLPPVVQSAWTADKGAAALVKKAACSAIREVRIPLPPDCTKIAVRRRMPGRGGPGAGLAVSQSVSGPFKLQRYGSEKKGRKLIYVASDLRGDGRHRGALTLPGPAGAATPPQAPG